MSRYQKVNGELTEEGYRKYGNVRKKARKDIVGGALTSAAGAGVGMFGGYAARKLSGGKVNLRFTPKVVGSVMSAHGGKRMAGGAYDLALNRAGITDDYGRLADSSNPLARPLIDGRKYALGAGATVGSAVPYAVKALNKDKDNLLGEAIRKTSAKKRVVVKNVERGPGVKDFSIKNSTRKKLNKGFKVINTPEEGPTVANEENKAEFIKPKKQRQNKKKVVIKNVERGPVTNEGNTAEPIKPKKKPKNKIFFKRNKKMSNPNNVVEDIDNLNEELMGKWKKGLKNIKHSSLGGRNNMYYEDEIYHSGYLDGYYASMELYHSDDSEMTEEERKARRRRRRRNIALGVAGAGGLGAAFIYAKAKEDKHLHEWAEAFRAAKEKAKNNLNKSGAETVSGARHAEMDEVLDDDIEGINIAGFRRNKRYNFLRSPGSYKVPSTSENWIPFSVARDRKLKRK